MDVAIIINLIISLLNIIATAVKSRQLQQVIHRVRVIESTPPSSPSNPEHGVSSSMDAVGDIVVHVARHSPSQSRTGALATTV